MQWTLIYHNEFIAWLDSQNEKLQDETLAHLEMLKAAGPLLGRPHSDTLKGSSLSNLKELRFKFQRKPIRILYLFDPERRGIILLGGDKSKNKRWYETNIPIAEKRYKQLLEDSIETSQ